MVVDVTQRFTVFVAEIFAREPGGYGFGVGLQGGHEFGMVRLFLGCLSAALERAMERADRVSGDGFVAAEFVELVEAWIGIRLRDNNCWGRHCRDLYDARILVLGACNQCNAQHGQGHDLPHGIAHGR